MLQSPILYVQSCNSTSHLKTRARIVLNLIVECNDVVNVRTDDIRDKTNVLRRLVVGLEGGLVLEDHGEAVGEALRAGGKVEAEVNRLDDSWELFLEVGDSLEEVVALGLGD